MEQFAFTFLLMVISAFAAIHMGQRTRSSKNSFYAMGLVTLVAQVSVLFALRA